MFNRQEIKENIQNTQEVICDFRGYMKNIEYRSPEYQNIISRKAMCSIKGYKSHPDFFDIMTKEGKSYYIGEKGE